MTATALTDLSADDLAAVLEEQRTAYAELKAKGLKLDLTRGKPSAQQLDLADDLLHLPTTTKDSKGVDVRNYGGLEGLSDLREMFAELLWVEPEQVVAGGNSSLTMMRDTLVYLMLFGGVDSERPWGREEKVRFVCPVPGYDRHFTLLESLGIEMVTVPMHDDGPDVDAVAALVADDPSVKGIWIVPTYANPSGAIVSQDVAARLAAMPTAAPDFKIFWDNAYALHHLTEEEAKSADILTLASAAGHPHRPIMFASTSKITYAGAGRRVPGRLDGQRRGGTSGTWATGRSAPTRSTTCATSSSSARPRACATTWPSTARSSRPSSPRWTGCSPSGSVAAGSRPGTPRPAATSSTSTSCRARPAAWSPSPRRPASR